jgi:hypothetical protein
MRLINLYMTLSVAVPATCNDAINSSVHCSVGFFKKKDDSLAEKFAVMTWCLSYVAQKERDAKDIV